MTQTAEKRVIAFSTLGFTMMFALWTVFAIIGLPIRKELGLSDGQFALLTALPVLTGSLLRLPAGLLADRLGGRRLFVGLTALTGLIAFVLPTLHSYGALLIAATFVGLSGVSFAIGNSWIARTVPGQNQGLALGTFGAGNVGSSITKLLAPLLIAAVPTGLFIPGGWRFVPFLYGFLLLLTALAVWTGTPEDKPAQAGRTLLDWLRPLRLAQVWRFGLYYVIFFGAYVALSLFLPKFYLDHYGVSLPQAGLLTALFIFPASLLRPLGGYLSDRFGPRAVTVGAFALMTLALVPMGRELPLSAFVLLTLAVGTGMGLGKAANFKLVAHWYPGEMGVVGGLVGMLGGLGGFALPLLFAFLKAMAGNAHAPFLLLLALTAFSGAVFVVSMTRLRFLKAPVLATDY